MSNQLVKTTSKLKNIKVKYKQVIPSNMSNLKEQSIEELEAELAKRKKVQQQKQVNAKKQYEKKRDASIVNLVNRAKKIAELTAEFKEVCHATMQHQATELAEYGKMRSNSKGGFSIANESDDMRVKRRRDTQPIWDERSTKAVELIKDFLSDAVKKKDQKLFDILMGFLERNQKGDLEYSRVMDLYQHEDKYEDPRWKEGLRLIKESFHNNFRGFGYEFQVKDQEGKWESLQLNFSSL